MRTYPYVRFSLSFIFLFFHTSLCFRRHMHDIVSVRVCKDDCMNLKNPEGSARKLKMGKQIQDGRFGFEKGSLIAVLVVFVATIVCQSSPVDGRKLSSVFTRSRPLSLLNHYNSKSSTSTIVLDLRGGAKKQRRKSGKSASLSSLNSTTKKKKTATGNVQVQSAAKKETGTSEWMTKYKNILPLTRIYITAVALVTLLGLALGEELAQAVLALDPIRTLYGWELWRPFTAACFLGSPSIGWLMSAYYLFEYGSSLERAYGTAQHAIFLGMQIILLSFASFAFSQPFFASSVITSMLHVLSRSMPNQKVKWLIFTVPYWSLPYGLMASDVLQAGSLAAALPHVLGILSGHAYFFHKFVWPKLNGGVGDWLAAPQFLVSALEGSTTDSAAKKSINAALKSRKKGKGKKLGGGK